MNWQPGREKESGEMSENYRVEVDRGGCDHCGAGKTWTVVFDDVAIGESFSIEEHAQDLADYMNQALERGRAEAQP
jgi:hypothetical protein